MRAGLPATSGGLVEEPAGFFRAAESSKRRALIVEDDFLIAFAMADMLREQGWEVIGPLPSGELAIEAALSIQPDVIIMDIRLQGTMSGLEASEVIRGWLPTTPIIFCTAQSDAETRQRAMLVGASLVSKPTGAEALKGALIGLAARNSAGRTAQP